MLPTPSSPFRAGRLRLLLAGVLALFALAACSSSPSGGGGGQEPAGSGQFPVTVEHKYGSTEVARAPQKVITLGYTDPDSLLAVGVAPVGIVNWFVVPPPNNKWQWQEAGYAGAVPEEVGKRDEYNLEKIAQMQPDLIIAGYSGMTQAQYDQVSKIAPTVAQPKGYPDFTAPWQVMSKHIMKAVGQEQRADELVAQTEARIKQVADAHPQWKQQTAVAAQLSDPNYAVFAKGDIKADFLSALGFQAPPQIAQEAAGKSDITVSPERVSLLNQDKLFFFARNPGVEQQIRAKPEFAALPVVQQQRVEFLYTTEPMAAALGYGSVISFPYLLDQIVPVIEKMPNPPAGS